MRRGRCPRRSHWAVVAERGAVGRVLSSLQRRTPFARERSSAYGLHAQLLREAPRPQLGRATEGAEADVDHDRHIEPLAAGDRGLDIGLERCPVRGKVLLSQLLQAVLELADRLDCPLLLLLLLLARRLPCANADCVAGSPGTPVTVGMPRAS